MLQVDRAGQRRFLLLGGVVALLLGAMVVSGLMERFSIPNPLNSSVGEISEAELARIRESRERARALRDSAVALAKKQDWAGAAALLESETKKEDTYSLVRLWQAEALFRAGDKRARTLWAELITENDPVSEAVRRVLKGDENGYRRFSEEQIKQANSDAEAGEANNIAWIVALAPNALTDYTKAVALARRGAEGASEEDKPNFLNTFGAILYRAGQYKEAVAVLKEAESFQKEPFNWPFLAMAHYQLGDTKAAQRYLGDLRKHLDATFGSPMPTYNRHELLLFYAEAEALVSQTETGSPNSL